MKMPLALVLIAVVLSAIIYTVSRPVVSLALLVSPVGRPVLNKAIQDDIDSHAHAKYFLSLIRQHHYAEARSVMTPAAKNALSVAALQSQWAAFENVHGHMSQWKEAGTTNSLLPEYVEQRYQVYGTRGRSGMVTLHLTKPADSWLVNAVTISR